ncbi:hypothetical protein QBC45DRAFT_420955 [Copromyces sp. CBS 386.78]|nr:hypothetical protein QBC45DRAFT_420955 [Copromyces sp. CBS 386.78]
MGFRGVSLVAILMLFPWFVCCSFGRDLMFVMNMVLSAGINGGYMNRSRLGVGTMAGTLPRAMGVVRFILQCDYFLSWWRISLYHRRTISWSIICISSSSRRGQ